MHIEAGVVLGTKMILSYATAVGVVGMTAKLALDNIKENGALALGLKSLLATIAVFIFFQVFPHFAVGVSEVHLILGTTIFLLFGVAPALIGLALGLLLQGLFFAPFDLPQYGINITTLMASMLILNLAVNKIIPKGVAYKDITYTQMLKMSVVWQGAIISWVAFWAFYGQGFGAENLTAVSSFAGAYILVVLIEPLIDLAILSAVKSYHSNRCNLFFDKKLTNCNA
ncbi:MAG TPA: cobalt transporter [Campylobacterales bacterium]|nr:cobalt transporter [Campylobacterales bacterium]HIP42143.1 cobalt transporter [Campylobacterales bacterium]